MNRRLSCAAVIAAGLLALLAATSPAQTPISTVAELQAMQNDLATSYVLVNDIDASDTVNWNGGAGFAPVGDADNPFTGLFDGAGFSIFDLYINRPTSETVGLFGVTSDTAEVQNFQLVDSFTSGMQFVGGVAGFNNGYIASVTFTGAVGGSNYIGGIAGFSASGIVVSCAVFGVVAGNSEVGGLIGYGTDNLIGGVNTDAVVSGEFDIGGLLGFSMQNLVVGGVSAGPVIGTGPAPLLCGGIAGQSNQDLLATCRNSGDVSGAFFLGGVTGFSSSLIIDCYNSGDTLGDPAFIFAGGLAGFHDGLISRCYNDGVTSGGFGVGGLVGECAGQVIDSYNRGPVNGLDTVGGAIGVNDATGVTSNCYSAAPVTGLSTTGGFCGNNDNGGIATDCYWDGDIGGQAADVGQGDFTGITSQPTAQMMQQATFAGWDFGGVWSIIEDKTYPYFVGSEFGVSVEQALAQDDPTSGTPIVFDVVFGQPVTTFTSAGVDFSASLATVTDWVVVGAGAGYQIIVTGVSGTGPVIASVPEASAFAGSSPNLDSNSADNVVLFDGEAPDSAMTGPSGATMDTTATLTWTADDPGTSATGVASVELFSSFNGGAPVSLGVFPPNINTTDVDLNALGGLGVHFFYSQATDAIGNIEDAGTAPDDGTTLTLTDQPRVAGAVALASDTVQVAYDREMTVDAALLDPANYTFTVNSAAIFGAAVTLVSSDTVNITVNEMTDGSTYTVFVNTATTGPTDANGFFIDPAFDSASFLGVGELPSVTVEQGLIQADPSNVLPIVFDILFSEPVTGLTSAGIVLGGTAAGATVASLADNGDQKSFTLEVSVTGDGTVTADVAAGAALDAAENPNTASTSVDNVVTFVFSPVVLSAVATASDTVQVSYDREMTVDAALLDPANYTFTVNSAAIFAAAVTLVSSDTVNITVNEMTDGSTYTVFVNTATTGPTDTNGFNVDPAFNSAEFLGVGELPSVTVEQGLIQADPTNVLPIVFDILFSEPVTGLTSAGIVLGGTAAGATVTSLVDNGDQKSFTLEVSVTGDGTVTADVAAGAALDAAENPNTASTSVDNAVNFDATAPQSQMTAPAGISTTWTLGLEWAAQDPAGAIGAIPSGVDTVEVLYVKDAGASSGSVGVFPAATTGTLFDASIAGGDGVYFFYSIATDLAGNIEDAVAAVDDGTTVTVFTFPQGQDFETDAGEWSPGGAPQVTSQAVGLHTSGALTLTAVNNENCFGYWTSMPDELISVPGSLYHGAFTVSSTVADPALAPQTRLRVNTLKQYAYVYTVNSHSAADIAPTSTGVVYDLLFTPVPSAQLGDGIQLSFDLVNFDPSDAPDGQIALEEYLITRAEQADVDAGLAVEGGYDFAADSQGWSFLGMDLFGGAPPSGAHDGGVESLNITAATNMGNFGFWQSPTSPTIAAATIYRVDFTASTDVADPAAVPLTRLRTASENGQYTFHLEIASDPLLNDAALTTAPQTIAVYLYPHPALAGDALKYAFDLANFDFSDSADGTIRLHDLQILSGPAALIP